MSIRDEQKEQRRALIIDKAIELFAKKGYLDTKIGDIAKAADMSVGLMFHYFESKEKLFEEIVRYGTNATNTPREMNFENPLDYFEGFLKVLLQYVKEHPQTMYLFVIIGRIQHSEGVPPHIKEIAAGSLDYKFPVKKFQGGDYQDMSGQEYGYFREGDPYLLAFTFWSSIQGIMERLASAPELAESGRLPETDWIIDIIRGDKQ